METYSEEETKVFEQVAYLTKAASVTQDCADAIRLKYQKKHNLSGNEFYRHLGNYLKNTIGKYSL